MSQSIQKGGFCPQYRTLKGLQQPRGYSMALLLSAAGGTKTTNQFVPKNLPLATSMYLGSTIWFIGDLHVNRNVRLLGACVGIWVPNYDVCAYIHAGSHLHSEEAGSRLAILCSNCRMVPLWIGLFAHWAIPTGCEQRAFCTPDPAVHWYFGFAEGWETLIIILIGVTDVIQATILNLSDNLYIFSARSRIMSTAYNSEVAFTVI
ncbi:hypothetical protein DL89DRAFT_299612 [Linderina pennispora]|uniref:Uncharacterized protein n=1 Tax=Linderina pennispora TaxID=61395 RepID=A0A1Y1WKA1_9FUNG|nr:uncharacterized protein DL89DRAFT_299612 [Linderina pennispora]ORX73969.1 hypothetical protein DL89DRAFT_299612 [Linderina pennispora]